MKVTLKKAAELERAALKAAETIAGDFVGTTAYSIYDKQRSLHDVLGNVRYGNAQIMQEYAALQDTAFELRALVSEANARLGVNALLLQRRILLAKEQRAKLFLSLSATRGETNYDIVAEKIAAMRAAVAESLEYRQLNNDVISIRVVGADLLGKLAQDATAARRELTEVMDEITKINVTNSLAIPPHLVEVLQRHMLV